MDFRQFRYFITAAEELHFARAAEKLGIAQPALTQQIKSLESHLGAQLFLRTKRRVELTDIGRTFLQEVRYALAHAEKAARVARNMARGEAGQIDIGFVGSVAYETSFAQQLKRYREKFPEVQILLHEMRIQEQIDALRTQQLDVAIVRCPIPTHALAEVEHFVFSTQRLVLVLPEKHPLAAKPSVRLGDLADSAFLSFNDPAGMCIGQSLLDQCRNAGFEPKITQYVSDIATLISLTAAEFGIGMVPENVCHLRLPGICYRPLEGVEATSDLIVVYRRFEPSVAVNALLGNLKKASQAAKAKITNRKPHPSSK